VSITAELHDGTRLEFPDGTDPAVIQSTVQKVLKSKQEPPAAERAGTAIRDIPRQVGLTARYGLEGLGGLVGTFTEPARLAINPALRAAGLPEAKPLQTGATALADAVGLPSPQTANERVVGDAARTVASAGGLVGAASKMAANAAPGVMREVATRMAARPGVQAAGAAGAGSAGGSVREAGGDKWAQFVAALGGGLTAGLTAGGAVSAGNALSRGARNLKNDLIPGQVQSELVRADQTINLTLQRAGIDWSGVPERVKQSMRADVAEALRTGQPLNADALRRLLVFRRTETTPTVGQLTQDPGQITREMNLAKTGANSTDPSLQRLPQIQNQNVQTLLRQLDEAGAARGRTAPDAARAGIEALDSNIARTQGEIGGLYNAARDSQGRSLPLEGGTFTRRANELLDADNVGSFLPVDIAKKMNAIARGEYPLTVDVAEQLKTSIGRLQRNSADGNARRALGLVRQALDEAPLQNSQRVNPGNMPAVPGAVPPSVGAGEESMRAFNAARTANREFMQRLERNPALRAVHEGVEPDQFMQRFVVGRGATAADVRALRTELTPEAVGVFRDYVVRYLRDAATNSTDDIAKFSNAAYRKAFTDLQEKLPAFFSREEIQRLRDIGDAAKYMQAQPTGSAVNNSNSGALLLGKSLDLLDAFAQKVPLGLKDTISGSIQGMQQRQVMAPKNALMLPQPAQPGAIPVNPLLAGTVLVPEQPRKKNGRN